MAVSPPNVREPLDAALVGRFRDDLTKAAGRPPGVDERIALAVSGGADSMAMLALAHAALPGQVLVATFDHRLRPASAGEASMVGEACRALGVPHVVLSAATALPAVNVQAAARAARYHALIDWAARAGAALLATAHHADDQAETLLMRANRGAGLAGLAGIRQRLPGNGVAIVRPLLGWRRATLRMVAVASGLGFVDDPSNRDPRFDRARMREFLEGQSVLDVAQIAATAAHLGEADADVRTIRNWLWEAKRRAASAGEVSIDVADLPRTIRRLLVRMAIEEVRAACGIARPAFGDSANVEALLDALEAGRGATQAGVMALVRDDLWHFRTEPPRREHPSV